MALEDWEDVVRSFSESLRLIRERNVAKFVEPMLQSFQAVGRLRSGDREGAVADSTEAVTTADRYGAVNFQPLPYLTRAQVLREALGTESESEAVALLDRAATLIAQTQCNFLQPFLHLERGEWAKIDGTPETATAGFEAAARLFEEMGANGRAQRARESVE